MRKIIPGLALLMFAAGLGFGVQGYQGYRAEKAAVEAILPGPVDIGFSQFMTLHHHQAIGMAQLMLDDRPTPLAGLARTIAYGQLIEVGQMRGWLRLWREPVLPPTRSMGWMLLGSAPLDEELKQYLIDCERSPTGMPGLAADEEVSRLRDLDGRARDEHFLRMMLAHHEGGIPMARFTAANARLAVVRELAARIVLEQSKEAHLIRTMLAALAAGIENR